jgi:hypothetical protein
MNRMEPIRLAGRGACTVFAAAMIWSCASLSAVGQGASGPSADNGNTAVLMRRVASLRAQLQALDSKIADLRRRVPAAQEELEALMGRVGSIKPADPNDPDPPEKSGPMQVPYRPPFARVVHKGTPIVLVCQENCVSILDFEKFDSELEKAVKSQSQIQTLVKTGGKFDAGDFEIKIQFLVVGRDVMVLQEAERKEGQIGEAIKLATRAGSKVRTRLDELDAENSVIQFAVYPDSYDAFRQIREVVWEGKFSVNWIPLKHGDTISIGTSKGGIVEQ